MPAPLERDRPQARRAQAGLLLLVRRRVEEPQRARITRSSRQRRPIFASTDEHVSLVVDPTDGAITIEECLDTTGQLPRCAAKSAHVTADKVKRKGARVQIDRR